MRMVFLKQSEKPQEEYRPQEEEPLYRYDYNRDIYVPIGKAGRDYTVSDNFRQDKSSSAATQHIGYVTNHLEDLSKEGTQFLESLETEFQEVPQTWKQYDKSQSGRQAILDMEFREFKQALANKRPEQIKKELMHLMGACLYLYKGLNDE